MQDSSRGAGGWVEYGEQDARIHAFANPEPFHRNAGMIAGIVQRVLGASKADASSVVLSDGSAWLDYRAPGELWTRAHPVLPSREDAQRIARAALVKLEAECCGASDAWRKAIGGAALLPPVRDLREAALAAVPRPDRSCWDHWLYRCVPQLKLDGRGNARAPVLGAQVEVRIGHLGRVIGLRSRWHPLSGDVKYAGITPFTPPPGEGGHDDAAPQPAPRIHYVLDGDGMQQYYLAPFYARAEDHVLELYSASPWSLAVDIGRVRQGGDAMTLVALAEGGSGQYAYSWGAWPDAGLGGFIALGRGSPPGDGITAGASQVTVPNGAYIVAVNVLDRASGAFRHHRQLVASSPMQSPSVAMPVA